LILSQLDKLIAKILRIVKNYPIKKVYVEQVKNAILETLNEVSEDD